MLSNIKLSLNYFRIKNYLVDNYGYTPQRAAQIIKKLRRAKPDIRHEFINWFNTGNLPEDLTLYGISFAGLLKNRTLNIVSAFLFIDWYSRMPEEAYNFIVTPLKDDPKLTYENYSPEAKEKLEKYRIKIDEEAENTDDITAD